MFKWAVNVTFNSPGPGPGPAFQVPEQPQLGPGPGLEQSWTELEETCGWHWPGTSFENENWNLVLVLESRPPRPQALRGCGYRVWSLGGGCRSLMNCVPLSLKARLGGHGWSKDCCNHCRLHPPPNDNRHSPALGGGLCLDWVYANMAKPD